MPSPISSIWGVPHLLDHSTGLQTPLSATGISRTESILLDAVQCQLLPGKPGLHTNWLGTLNLPLLQPLTAALTLKLDLRFYVLQAVGGYIRVRFSAYGIGKTLDFQAANPVAIGQNCTVTMPAVQLPVGAFSFDCRFDLVVDRPDTGQQTQVNLDTIDIGATPVG